MVEPMRNQGTDRPVVVTKSGNADGAKGSADLTPLPEPPDASVRKTSGSSVKPYSISRELVDAAYRRVKANRGSSGVDGVTLEAFEKHLEGNLYTVWNRMSSGSYQPPAVRLVEIAKADGGVRPLGIPTVADRIAQTVVAMTLEPVLEPVFHPDSYGYRPNRSAHDAIAVTRQRCWTHPWVIDLDIKGFFDSLSHELVERAIAHHTELGWVRLYVGRWLRAPLQQTDGTLTVRTQGTPQGGVISPLLANVFLHYAFDMWMSRDYPGNPFARYADDLVVHCKTERQARSLLTAIADRLSSCGLTLHPGKTRIVYCGDGRGPPPQDPGRKYERTFDFLGYTFRLREVGNTSGRTKRVRSSFLPAMSRKGAERVRRVTRGWFHAFPPTTSLDAIARAINSTVRGWFRYYGAFYASECRRILQYINQCLTLWGRQKYGTKFRRRGQARRWLQGVYRRQPNLFAHWSERVIPAAASI